MPEKMNDASKNETIYWQVRKQLLDRGDIQDIAGSGIRLRSRKPEMPSGEKISYEEILLGLLPTSGASRTDNELKIPFSEAISQVDYLNSIGPRGRELLANLPTFFSFMFKAADGKLSTKEKIQMAREIDSIGDSAWIAPGLKIQFLSDHFKSIVENLAREKHTGFLEEMVKLVRDMPPSLKEKYMNFAVPFITKAGASSGYFKKAEKEAGAHPALFQALKELGIDFSPEAVKKAQSRPTNLESMRENRVRIFDIMIMARSIAWISIFAIWIFCRKPGVSFFKFGWFWRTLTPAGVVLMAIFLGIGITSSIIAIIKSESN